MNSRKTTKKLMKPFFTYFGGKYRAAPRYPKPKHDLIIEPFAGAAGYALRNYSPDTNVILNDLDEKVAGTWDYLINAKSSEILSLPLYDGTWETLDDLSLPQEQKWLIGWHLNKGAAAPSKRPSKWMREAETIGANYWGESIRHRISTQVDLIRHWEIRNDTYENLSEIEATWFIDPPYQVAGRGYRTNSIDYSVLSQWCQTRKGYSIVCENSGADWLPFESFATIKGTAGSKRTGTSKEVIWVNNN